MATFVDASHAAGAIVRKLIAKNHPDLEEAKVTVCLLFAHATRSEQSGQPTGPALKHQGWPAHAIAKINSLQDRVEGKQDCTIKIDGDDWPLWDDARRLAILDHELAHFQVLRFPGGIVKTDDCGRPKLRMRLHDFQFGGFVEIVRRHGPEAIEAVAVEDAWRRVEQAMLPFIDVMAPLSGRDAKVLEHAT